MNDLPIKFKFNAKKAAQAANLVLRRSGGQRNYLELVKLLYMADRESLLRLQSQITGDQLEALPLGPVLSHILDLIRWGPINEEDAPWFEAVSPPSGYDVKAIGTPGTSELSGAECAILDEVFEKYGHMSWKQLSRMTHELPEWVDPNGGHIPIPPEHILRLEGHSPAEIEHIKQDLSLGEALDREVTLYEGQEFEVPQQPQQTPG